MNIIFKAANIIEANIVSGLLKANGIDAYAGGYYLQGGVGDLAAMDFANVYVAEKDIPQAQRIIEDYENSAIE